MLGCRLFCSTATGALVLLLAAGQPAHAQDVAGTPAPAAAPDENALRAASDAFGTSIGRESIGLYSPSSVRGFSPYAAGNIRIEGLYIDAVTLPNNRLVTGSAVRVGISAQGYPFPAPTGVADYRLRIPGDRLRGNSLFGVNSYGGVNAELNVELPIAEDRLAFGGGINVAHDSKLYWGGKAKHMTAAAVLRIRPADNVEILPFYSYFTHADEHTHPRLTVTGTTLPGRIKRATYYGQPWTIWTQEQVNYGVIGRVDAGDWKLSAGIFRSDQTKDINYSDQFQGVSPEGLATNHRIVISPRLSTASTSGEIRLSRRIVEGERSHMIHLSVRGRDQDRRYGGGRQYDFGPAAVEAGTVLLEPLPVFGPQARDGIRQLSGGIAYEGIWSNVGEVSLGLQKTDYEKVTNASDGTRVATKSRPWLYNAGLAVHVAPGLVAYGGYTRGLEESASAPETAANRDQAPPSILTRQYDAGIRWELTRSMKMIAGLFNVEKPYFSVDADRLYRELGEVRHRGIELSLVGRLTDDLNLLAGAILMDATVHGEAVRAGLVGGRPVGSSKTLVSLNAEYAVPGIKGLALDAGTTTTGRRVANTANTLSVPGVTTVDAGLRYGFMLADRPATFRVQASNLFDTYDWEIVSSNSFAYQRGREVTARLTMAF
ncbi:TonB-dependent siderophore receptor [Sphingomonas sp. SCN 67-18]|uniref:TonB-dependent siderophore receptor n=1 Tax=uncultured Sphingomonas sp. TaxID=158754 RepID=UPI0025F7A8C4|nr:TonB-dependent receptor [Sphingomonas sp. SCN 67-18]